MLVRKRGNLILHKEYFAGCSQMINFKQTINKLMIG